MQVNFKKINPYAITPTRAYKGDAGYDLYAFNQYIIKPGETIKVATGIILEIPEGYYMEIVPRSGISYKTMLRIANSPGIIDSGYRGEVMVLMNNISTDPFNIYTINRGDKIAQMILRKLESYDLQEVEVLSESERSDRGFGSSGI